MVLRLDANTTVVSKVNIDHNTPVPKMPMKSILDMTMAIGMINTKKLQPERGTVYKNKYTAYSKAEYKV